MRLVLGGSRVPCLAVVQSKFNGLGSELRKQRNSYTTYFVCCYVRHDWVFNRLELTGVEVDKITLRTCLRTLRQQDADSISFFDAIFFLQSIAHSIGVLRTKISN
jgi:hypothetical protein